MRRRTRNAFSVGATRFRTTPREIWRWDARGLNGSRAQQPRRFLIFYIGFGTTLEQFDDIFSFLVVFLTYVEGQLGYYPPRYAPGVVRSNACQAIDALRIATNDSRAFSLRRVAVWAEPCRRRPKCADQFSVYTGDSRQPRNTTESAGSRGTQTNESSNLIPPPPTPHSILDTGTRCI